MKSKKISERTFNKPMSITTATELSAGDYPLRILKVYRAGLRKQAETIPFDQVEFHDVRNRAEYLKADIVMFYDDNSPEWNHICLKNKYGGFPDFPKTRQTGTRSNPVPVPTHLSF
jgi:hypothetical protein